MPIDYSKYPPDWRDIRKRILDRAEHKCEFCGVENHKLIFRGLLNDKEVYQYSDASIYLYPTGVYQDTDAFSAIQPISGKERQKAIKIVLTIAHLDHDEQNHDVKDERLAALCQKCHLRYDIEEKKKRRKVKKFCSSLFPMNENQ